MNSLEEICCLCLSISNSPYINVFSKNEDGLSHFDKIFSTLSQLANVSEFVRRAIGTHQHLLFVLFGKCFIMAY